MQYLKMIPKGAVITPIKLSKEQLVKVEEIRSQTPYPISECFARNRIKRIIGGLCAGCYGIPEIEIRTKVQGITRLQRYCEKCAKTLFERMEEEPEDMESIAKYYGCQKGDIHSS